MKTCVSPEDCAIVVGVPITRERFVQRFRAAEEGSFIFEYLLRGKAPERNADAAWQRWSDTAGRIEKTLRHVEHKGVTVKRDASPDDLLDVMKRFEVVTVVSHWRSALFRASDLRDPRSLSAALADPRHALHATVHGLSGARPNGADAVAELNRALFANGRDTPSSGDTAAPGALSTLQAHWHERRQRIESCLPDGFDGGASIEFADGLVPVERIVGRVPRSFDRLLDLTICTSVLMATRIKQRAPSCYVACNECLTYPLPRMLIYRHVVDLLSKRPGSFEDTVFRVRGLIQSEIDREKNRKAAEQVSR